MLSTCLRDMWCFRMLVVEHQQIEVQLQFLGHLPPRSAGSPHVKGPCANEDRLAEATLRAVRRLSTLHGLRMVLWRLPWCRQTSLSGWSNRTFFDRTLCIASIMGTKLTPQKGSATTEIPINTKDLDEQGL